MSFAGSNLDNIVEKMITAIAADEITPFALKKLIGEDDRARTTPAPPRIVVVPRYDDGIREAHERPDDGNAAYETTTICQVECWGNDLTQATQLRDVFLRQGWTLFSPNAFKALRKPGAYSKGLSTADKGNKITVWVGFVIPIYSEMFMQGHIATATTSLDATDPDGSNPEDFPT